MHGGELRNVYARENFDPMGKMVEKVRLAAICEPGRNARARRLGAEQGKLL